jgi:hypothetical protein
VTLLYSKVTLLYSKVTLLYSKVTLLYSKVTLVAPLTSNTRSTVKYIWTDDYERTFDNVKYALTHAPVLTLPKLGEPFEVVSDSSLGEVIPETRQQFQRVPGVRQ